MDNATHTLTGLFLSRAGLNRLTPAATPILLLSANAPDIDVISALGGSASYLHWHRHLTHSLVMLPVMALASAAVVRIFFRHQPFPWVAGFLVALAGVASHVLLDLTNIYGVRLLLPFSGRWFHWDLTEVIDLIIWAVLVLCIAAPALSKLVSSEIGSARRDPYPPRGFAILALLFLATYNLGRAVLHARATGVLESRQYDGEAPARVAAFPGGQNPLLWRGVAETSEAYHLFRINLLQDFNPALGEAEYKTPSSPAIEAARATQPFRVLEEFAQFPVYRVVPSAETPGGWRVVLYDLRFGFTSMAIVDRDLHVVKTSFQFGGPRVKYD